MNYSIEISSINMALQYVKQSEYDPAKYTDTSNLVVYRDNAFEVNPEQGYYAYKDSSGNTRYSLRKTSGGSTTVEANSLQDALKQATAEYGGGYIAGTAFFNDSEEASQLTQTEQFFQPLPSGGFTEDPKTKEAILAGTRTPSQEKAQASVGGQTPSDNRSVSLVEGGQNVTQNGQTTFEPNPNFKGQQTGQQEMAQQEQQAQVSGQIATPPPRTGVYAAQPGESENDRITRLKRFGLWDPAKELEDIKNSALSIQAVLNQPATPSTQTTYTGMEQKYGFPPAPVMEQSFLSDPIGSIKAITNQIFNTLGMGEANADIESITGQIEDLENKRDDEIRDINDNPWLTEGVRIDRVRKAQEKWR